MHSTHILSFSTRYDAFIMGELAREVQGYEEKKKANIIGERVREARLKAKPQITQEELMARLQILGLEYIDQAKISRIEKRLRPVYDYEIIPLGKALGVSANWLLSGQN